MGGVTPFHVTFSQVPGYKNLVRTANSSLFVALESVYKLRQVLQHLNKAQQWKVLSLPNHPAWTSWEHCCGRVKSWWRSSCTISHQLCRCYQAGRSRISLNNRPPRDRVTVQQQSGPPLKRRQSRAQTFPTLSFRLGSCLFYQAWSRDSWQWKADPKVQPP